MIHIKKNKKELFYVSYLGENGEILATSESFATKQSAWKNISSMYKNLPNSEHLYVEVIDMTGKKPQTYAFNVISKSKEKR